MPKRISTIPQDQIDQVLAFHGHICPGVTRGIRVAEIALRELGSGTGDAAHPRAIDEELVAVCETNNCSLDAIQFLVGCTFGKGNLIHLDHGQNIFTFSRRSDGRTIRISAKPGPSTPNAPETQMIVDAVKAGAATPEQQAAYDVWWSERSLAVLDMDEADLFDIVELDEYTLPEPAQIYASIPCERCGQLTMAPRLTQVGDRLLCYKCARAEGMRPIVVMRPVGVVHSPLIAHQAPPRAKARATIVVDEGWQPALEGIERYSKLLVLFQFESTATTDELLQHPRGDKSAKKRGIFALRTPRRPNPIGATVVDIVSVEGNVVTVDGLDAWDGSPVLDLKGER